VAVVHVGGEPTVAFLCRSLSSGAALANYPALLLDIRSAEPLAPDTQEAIERAAQFCLTRQQWFGVVVSGDSLPEAIHQARQWQRLVVKGSGPRGGVARNATRVVVSLLRAVADVIGRIGPARARFPR